MWGSSPRARRSGDIVFQLINGRLSIGLRLALIASLFILSAAVSAVIQFQRGSENSDFSKKELLGAQYNAQIWNALQNARRA